MKIPDQVLNCWTVWFAAVEMDATDPALLEMVAVSGLNFAEGWIGQVALGQAFDPRVWFVAVAEMDAIDPGQLETVAETEPVWWIDRAAPGLDSANQGRVASGQALWKVRFAGHGRDAFDRGLVLLDAGDFPPAVVPVLSAGVVYRVGLVLAAIVGRFGFSRRACRSGRFVGRLSEPEFRVRVP